MERRTHEEDSRCPRFRCRIGGDARPGLSDDEPGCRPDDRNHGRRPTDDVRCATDRRAGSGAWSDDPTGPAWPVGGRRVLLLPQYGDDAASAGPAGRHGHYARDARHAWNAGQPAGGAEPGDPAAELIATTESGLEPGRDARRPRTEISMSRTVWCWCEAVSARLQGHIARSQALLAGGPGLGGLPSLDPVARSD